jgi:hypothetical protein
MCIKRRAKYSYFRLANGHPKFRMVIYVSKILLLIFLFSDRSSVYMVIYVVEM